MRLGICFLESFKVHEFKKSYWFKILVYCEEGLSIQTKGSDLCVWVCMCVCMCIVHSVKMGINCL